MCSLVSVGVLLVSVVLRLSLGAEGTMFDQQATSAVLDMMGDEGRALNQHKRIM